MGTTVKTSFPTRALAGLVDRAASAAHRLKNRNADPSAHDPVIAQAIEHYERAFAFQEADVLDLRETLTGGRERDYPSSGIVVRECTWESQFSPSSPEPHRTHFLAHRKNRTGHVRFYGRTQASKTACIFLHGYLGGFYPWETRKFPCKQFAEAGIDVALPLLPFHGFRAQLSEQSAPLFPGHDPFMTVEGFRQAIFDLHGLERTLRARGSKRIAIVGVSLGAYIAALYCTLHAIDFLSVITPLASLSDTAFRDGRLGKGTDADVRLASVERVLQCVSPLHRPALTKNVLVVGAEQDAITPFCHAEQLAAHFGTTVHRIPGGHIIATGRKDAFGKILRELTRKSGPAYCA
jgi:pimeloyl-ACP methyl ester carboxylesterase